jgi:predicted phage terminase large subunit-like protein
LGYDFEPSTHRELFEQYPAFRADRPWADQFTKRDVLVLWPRGHFKTTAIVVVVVQAILVNPNIRVLLMQGTTKVTKNLLKEIASHFNSEARNSGLAKLFPDFCGDHRELGQTANEFTVPCRTRRQLAQATVTVASPRAVKTGQHYDLGIFDDLVNDQNYRSPVQLAKVEEDFNMCLPLIDPGCPRFVSGTRYAFGDLYENIIKKDQGKNLWTISVKTCWADDPNHPRFPVKRTRDGRTVGFTREGLLQIMRDTPQMFASQYLNCPILESQQYITEKEMLASVVSPGALPPLSSAVIFVDLAVTDNVQSDDSVIMVGKVDGTGKMYVVDAWGKMATVSETALYLIALVLKHRPLKVCIENTHAAPYFVAYLQTVCREKGIAFPIEYLKLQRQFDAKNQRVQALCGHIRNRRFFFTAGLPGWEKLVKQILRFPKGRAGHDDWPDTAALMCNHLSIGYVGVAPQVQATRHPVVAILAMDPVARIEKSPDDWESSEPVMGGDFCS